MFSAIVYMSMRGGGVSALSNPWRIAIMTGMGILMALLVVVLIFVIYSIYHDVKNNPSGRDR